MPFKLGLWSEKQLGSPRVTEKEDWQCLAWGLYSESSQCQASLVLGQRTAPGHVAR